MWATIEHGDLHGQDLNAWFDECAKGDPEPHHLTGKGPPPGSAANNGRLGGMRGRGGRHRMPVSDEVGWYRLIEEVEGHFGNRKRLMVRIKCKCGQSPVRLVQRADWQKPSMATGCNQCIALRRRAAAQP